MNDELELLTPAQVAKLARVSMATIRRDIHDGLLHANRVGRRSIRISQAEAERYARWRLVGEPIEATG